MASSVGGEAAGGADPWSSPQWQQQRQSHTFAQQPRQLEVQDDDLREEHLEPEGCDPPLQREQGDKAMRQRQQGEGAEVGAAGSGRFRDIHHDLERQRQHIQEDSESDSSEYEGNYLSRQPVV